LGCLLGWVIHVDLSSIIDETTDNFIISLTQQCFKKLEIVGRISRTPAEWKAYPYIWGRVANEGVAAS
jgi:hypothetical protein